VTNPGGGFDVLTNVVSILKQGESDPVRLPEMSKLEVANRVLDKVKEIRRAAGETSPA
jgi:hypothetical protein